MNGDLRRKSERLARECREALDAYERTPGAWQSVSVDRDTHPALWRFLRQMDERRRISRALDDPQKLQARLKGRFEASRDIVREFLS